MKSDVWLSLSAVRWRVSIVSWLVVFALSVFTVRSIEATEYFVAVDHPNASDSNDGLSLAEPFETLGRAVQELWPGDTLNIEAGVYRESLTTVRSGAVDSPILIRAYPGDEGEVVIRGSDAIQGWSNDGGNVWSVPWTPLPLINFPSGWPYVTEFSRRREIVFIDGSQLEQVMSYSDLSSGRFWMDDGAQRIRIHVSQDPNGSLVEIAARDRGVMATGSYQIFRGLRVEHVTTTIWIGAMHLGPNQTVEECGVEYNNGYGVVAYSSLMFLGSTSNHNGRLGIALNGNNSLMDSSETSHNSWRYGPRFDAGGIKVTGELPTGNRFVRHESSFNNGIGIWFDSIGSGNVVDASFFNGNFFGAIEFEAALGPNWVTNNVIVGTVKVDPGGTHAIDGAGIIVFDSNDTRIINNTIVDVSGPGISIAGDSRNTGGTFFHVDNTLTNNNIIVNSGRAAVSIEWLWGTAIQEPRVGSHHFDYNLYYDNAVTIIFPDVPNIYGYEYWDLAEWQANRGEDLNSIAENPRFVRPAAYDYSLQVASPAIDSGLNVPEVIADFLGQPRPHGLSHDIGAYECGPETTCGCLFADGFESGNLSAWFPVF